MMDIGDSWIILGIVLFILAFIGVYVGLSEGPEACELINGEWQFSTGGFGTYYCNVLEHGKLVEKKVTKYKGQWIESTQS